MKYLVFTLKRERDSSIWSLQKIYLHIHLEQLSMNELNYQG